LIGELSESGLPRVYVGQSGNVGKRLVQHNQDNDKGKDFWNRALVVVSLTNSMTQTHALFLEWFAIGQATQAGRYSLENGNAGARPHTSAPLEADCHEIHETAATLLATLGQPIFEPLTNAATSKGDKELFYCKASGADGVGTRAPKRAWTAWHPSSLRSARIRQQLAAEGIMAAQGGVVVFTRDHLFASPSMAAVALMGRSANGWAEWKTPQGQTLDEVKRQAADVAGVA
jgi:Domain of unknown function (DUF4357)